MNDQKAQTGKRAQLNAKTPWYVSALCLIGVDVSGLTKRQVKDMAHAKLGRSKHVGGRKRHAIKRTLSLCGRSDRHVRTMGRRR